MDRNYRIEGLRAVLIIWVVLHHYTFRYNGLVSGKFFSFWPKFDHGGEIGVMMFLIISGYFMGKMISVRGVTPIRWFFRRYWQLWLPYFFSVLTVFLWMTFAPFPGRTTDYSVFVVNLLFMAHPGVDYVEGAHWYIAALVETYLLASLVLFFKSEKLRKHLLVGMFMIVTLIFLVLMRLIAINIEWYWFLLVCEGVFIGLAIRFNKEVWWCLPFVGLLVIWLAHIHWLYAVYILLFCLCFYRGNSMLNKIMDFCLSNRLMVFVGGVSYPWYLVHQNIGYSLMYYFLPDGTGNSCWLILPISVTFLLAVVIRWLVGMVMNGITALRSQLIVSAN